MTTGSWNSSGTYGLLDKVHYKTWVGGDRPKAVYIKKPIYYIYRDGKAYKINPNHGVNARPPKRVSNAPHNYEMHYRNHRQHYVYKTREFDCSTYALPGVGTWSNSLATNVTHSDGTNYSSFAMGENDRLKIIGKLREKLVGSDFNMSVFLGEGHQTLGLIADSATRIYRAMKSVRTGNIAHAANILVTGTARESAAGTKAWKAKALTKQTVGSAWLELQYGWLPLLKDAEAAAQMLAHQLTAPFRQKVKAGSRKSRVTVKTVDGNPVHCAPDHISYTLTTYETMQYILYVDEKMSTPAVLGLLNPENVAWELMPWSFVVDWFIPIGQYLEARAFSSCVSGQAVLSQVLKFMIGPITNSTSGKWSDPDYQQYGVDCYRSVYASLGSSVPLPSFKGLGQVASWQHCANAVALLVQGDWGAGSSGFKKK